MANPLEKQFIVILGNRLDQDEMKKYTDFIENQLVPTDESGKADRNKFLYWMRTWSGRLYHMGTLENTIWTAHKIHRKISLKFPELTTFVVEVQDRECQGNMGSEFWEHMKNCQDLTKYMDNNARALKLKLIKKLIQKKEDLRKKAIQLKLREEELQKRKEELTEEEELLKKEEQIKREELELDKKETEIKKRKKFLGIF